MRRRGNFGSPFAERCRVWGGRRVSSKDVYAMTTQLSTAVRAGLPLLNCLELLRKQQRKPGMRRMFEHLTKSVSGGMSLSEAMGEHKEVFSPLYLSMIRVGETGGILEQTSLQLAMILGREEKVKANMKTASAYPIFLLGLGHALRHVDRHRDAAEDPGDDRYRGRLHADADADSHGHQPILAVFVHERWRVGGSGRDRGRIIRIAALDQDRRAACRGTRFKLKIPILGPVLRTIAVGRFARTLGSLTKGGVTILEALAVVRDTLGNEVLAREVDTVAEKVKRGESLADPLEQSGRFPPLLIQIVAIGEQTGKLDELLLNAADTFRLRCGCGDQPVHGDLPRHFDSAVGPGDRVHYRGGLVAHRHDVGRHGRPISGPGRRSSFVCSRKRGIRMIRVRRQAKGFTLIELMVVILIIAMLGTFVAPNVMSKLKARQGGLWPSREWR